MVYKTTPHASTTLVRKQKRAVTKIAERSAIFVTALYFILYKSYSIIGFPVTSMILMWVIPSELGRSDNLL